MLYWFIPSTWGLYSSAIAKRTSQNNKMDGGASKLASTYFSLF